MAKKEPYVMTISRTTVDKLGIKLYDKASAVVAETVANCYDADAENVRVRIPLDKWLATRSNGEMIDKGLEISIEDDGHGIAPELINDFYLKVGTNPRTDPRRGPFSLEKRRPRMGRKGIGKLAPFGICRIMEVRTAGGKKTPQGYKTAHFIMNYDEIRQETDAPYYPEPGKDDGTYSQKRGTIVKLRNFLPRRTPNAETFCRQLARRFGLELPDFRIEVEDTTSNMKFPIGQLEVEIQEGTKIQVEDKPVTMDDGTKLPVTGWVAYAKHPYKNEDVAGVRIYARGKIVSTTRDFGLEAGFHGEHNLRSYLVGLIHADWIDKDDEEDLVRSDRQDILWASEKGEAFQRWGQQLLKELGKISLKPMRQKAWKIFLENSNLEEEAKKRFEDENVREAAMTVGKTIGSIASLEDLQDTEYVQNLKELVLTVAPHKMIVDKLREVESLDIDHPLDLVARIFNDAKVAEAASLGQVAIERIGALDKLERILESQTNVDEAALQKLLEGAPWLINPQWTVLQANQTFETLRSSFERWYHKEYGQEISTTSLGKDKEKRPDFVMLHIGRRVEIVEIKRPGHSLEDDEFSKLQGYIESIQKFMAKNPNFQLDFPEVHSTLVCDDLRLNPVPRRAYKSLVDDGLLEKKTWEELLRDTKKVHEAFLKVLRYRQGE